MRTVTFNLTVLGPNPDDDFLFDGGVDVEVPPATKMNPAMVACAMKSMARAVLTGDTKEIKKIVKEIEDNTKSYTSKPIADDHLTLFS